MRRLGSGLVLAVLAATGGAVPLAATAVVEAAPPGVQRTVRFLADGRPDPCVTWYFAGLSGRTVWIVGYPSSGSCAAPPQHSVELPGLDAGRYRLVAFLASGEIWDGASFTVGEIVSPPGVLIDLAPTDPGPGDPVEVVVTSVDFGFNDSIDFAEPPVVLGDRIVFTGEASFCPITCPPPSPVEFRGRRFVLPPLTAGLKVIELRLGQEVVGERAFTVGEPPEALFLRDRRFELRLEWRDHQGLAHAARAETLTAESGQFWFFDRGNVELTVKILDGRAINDAFWLFAASMTDLAYRLTVIDHDTSSCGPSEGCPRVKTYDSPAGENHNLIDHFLSAPIPTS